MLLSPGRRILRGSAAVFAAAVLVGSCGDKGPTPLQVLQATTSKTVEGGTSKLSLSIATADTSGQPAITGEGVFDYETKRGRLTMDLGALGGPGQAADSQAELIILGDTIYLRMAALAQLLEGKQWIKVTASSGGGLLPAGSTDPAGVLSSLRGLTGEVKSLGASTVRGEPTTHYQATVDLRRAGELGGASESDLSKLDALGEGANVPVEVWVDSQGRARRMQMASGTAPRTTVTVEMFDFGTPVDVEAPPADQVSEKNPLQSPAG